MILFRRILGASKAFFLLPAGDVGFQLPFAATLGLMLYAPGFKCAFQRNVLKILSNERSNRSRVSIPDPFRHMARSLFTVRKDKQYFVSQL